jgi:hypothetical protein
MKSTLLVLLLIGFGSCLTVNYYPLQISISTFSTILDIEFSNETQFIDFAPQGGYMKTSCILKLWEVWNTLWDSSICEEGRYDEFHHNVWILQNCSKGDNDTISASIGMNMTTLSLDMCYIGNNTIPQFKPTEDTFYFAIVTGDYIVDAKEAMSFEADIHFDTKPSLSNVLGTNYIFVGPIFHQSAPYGNNVVITNVSDVMELHGYELSTKQVAFLSHIKKDTRTYSGTFYIVATNHTTTVEIDSNVIMTVSDMDDNQNINVEEFNITFNNILYTLTSAELISSCPTLEKVVYTNGIYRLSQTNRDHCSRYSINLACDMRDLYITNTRHSFQFSYYEPWLKYAYNGTADATIDWAIIGVDKLKFTFAVVILIDGVSGNDFYISDIEKIFYNTTTIKEWKSTKTQYGFQVDIEFNPIDFSPQNTEPFDDVYAIKLGSDIEEINGTEFRTILFTTSVIFPTKVGSLTGYFSSKTSGDIVFLFSIIVGVIITVATSAMLILQNATIRNKILRRQ